MKDHLKILINELAKARDYYHATNSDFKNFIEDLLPGIKISYNIGSGEWILID